MRVTIFGGGIAGLTAAHELAERGFTVQLVERASTPDGSGVAVGGLARTQPARLPLPVARARLDAAARGAPPDEALPAAPSAVDDRAHAVVPGEHGFRFFPAFYRHLADTMRRTPLDDGRTAHDRLVPVPRSLFVRPGAAPAMLRRERPRSVEELRRELSEWLRAVGFGARDAAFYLLRLLRYVTSAPARRAREYEALSWWDFLTRRRLDEPDAGTLPYGDEALAFLRHTPRALVAMDPVHSDARTQGNILVQLLRDPLAGEGPVDAALDGPTSDAWLTPWRRWLERLGVRFFHGRLVELTVGDDRRVGAIVEPEHPGALDGYEPTSDYTVVALDLVGAQRATERLAAWGRERGVDVGVAAAVQPFALEVPAPDGSTQRRHPERETGVAPWDRLQTLTGVQLYFGHRVELARGYVYYTRSPWALTSFAQSFRWARPPIVARDGYLALHSVDVGELPRAAWGLSKSALVDEVLRQMREALPGPIPSPIAFHVDDFLEYDSDRLVRNRAPYLINIAGDWARRPGTPPVDPRRPSTEAAPPLRTPVVWQPDGGGYAVHFDQVVFAGTWLRTFTRLTSMEAANESARHVVNAILAHADARLGAGEPPSTTALPDGALRPTRLGDLCAIWDPEEHELPDLALVRALDEELLARGLGHLFDLLDLDALPEALAPDEPDPIGALLRHLGELVDRELLDGGADVGGDALRPGVLSLVELLRAHLAA